MTDKTSAAEDVASANVPAFRVHRLMVQGAVVQDVLRCFDKLRRELAQETHGNEGAFAGYDSLKLDHPGLAAAQEVIVSAVVTSGSDTTQTLRFCAFATSHPTRSFLPTGLVADARGRTVALSARAFDRA